MNSRRFCRCLSFLPPLATAGLLLGCAAPPPAAAPALAATPAATAPQPPVRPDAPVPPPWTAPAEATATAIPVPSGSGGTVAQATDAPPARPPSTPATDGAAARERFVADMQARGLPADGVRAVLGQARYSPTVARLVLPPESPSVRSWPRYRTRFVETRRIREGVAFGRQHADALARAEARHGVPAAVIVSIIGVETFYGRVMGNFRVVDALATLAFDYPAGARTDRSAYFREQLGEFLVWCRENRTDPLSIKGSYAGAIGLPQFMPGSIRAYAEDGDGDGRIDLAGNPTDAIASVARFLTEHGWQRGQAMFVPARAPADASALVGGGLAPTQDWPRLREAGAHARPSSRPDHAGWQSWKLGVVDLFDGATGTTEYRIAGPNFFAVTHYNRSYFYATAVADLASAIEAGLGQAPAR